MVLLLPHLNLDILQHEVHFLLITNGVFFFLISEEINLLLKVVFLLSDNSFRLKYTFAIMTPRDENTNQ
ncbi:hypothetical protein X975_15994, partial [Stegodyphus mimosarum]